MAEGKDERSFLEKIDENFLICSICSERYNKAKCLPCLHTFCEQCLSQLLKKTGKLDCPICRRTCAVPSGGVGMLQNNFFINDLVEQFRLREDSENGESTKCGWCEENEGDEVRCIDCDMNLCSTCARPHRRVPATRKHQLMPLKEYKEAKVADPASVIAPMQCSKHSNHPLAYFCVTCDEVICLECTVIDHRAPEHKHQYLKESAKIYVKELEQMRANLEGKERELNESKEKIERTRASLEERYNQETRKLNFHIEGIIQQVRDIGTQFAGKLRSKYESRKTILQGQVKELQRTEDDLSSTCEYIKNISDFGGAAQLMIAKKGITSQAQQLMKTETKVKPKESDYMEFSKADELVKIEAAVVGDVLFKEMYMDVKKVSKSMGSTLDLAIVLKACDQTPLFTSTDEVRCTITGCGDSEVQMQVKSGEEGALLLHSGNLQLEKDCKLSLLLCGTQMRSARNLKHMSLEPLRFHHRCEGGLLVLDWEEV
ncbi:E3 ubiquitin-protein ligase TRIM56-like [Ptychodera flava]|uniref:E3 ubiquitin-protein ligase TRIM56-like n=1 Tax=Ptychodera flava TaxID=63121 RepID=UPI003969EB14